MTAATYIFAQLIRALPRTRITRAVGRLCDMPLPPAVSRAAVGAFVRAYGVDLHEAEAPEDNGGVYPSFDAFFTRPLREGVRPIAEVAEDALVAPADGRLDATGPVTRDGTIVVKGRPYRAADLLGGEDAAERHLGGSFAVIYLSPRDYHRVHTPCAGKLIEVRSLPGDLFPVNGVSERHIPSFLARNRRVAMMLETERGERVSVVMVAAMIVGRITVTGIAGRDVPFGVHRPQDVALARGDELGVFHLGSTAVVFTEPGAHLPLDRPLGRVLLGESLHRDAGGSREPSSGKIHGGESRQR